MTKYSQSTINCFNACRQKFKYRYVDCIEPKIKNLSMRLGSVFHDSLSNWYKTREAKFMHDGVSTDEELKEFIMMQGLFEGYVEKYQNDDFKVAESEVQHSHSLKKYLKSVGATDSFTFIPDMIVEKDGKLKLVEFKTKGRFDYSMMDKLDIDIQIQLYLFFLYEEGIIVDEVIYRIIKKPAIRQTQKETVSDYLNRLQAEIRDNPEKYFIEIILPVDKQKMKDSFEDMKKQILLIRHCKRLKCYDKNTTQCTLMGTCEYLTACLKQEGWEHLYQLKEVR